MRIWLVQPKDADFAAIAVIPWLIPVEPEGMIEKLRTRLRRKTTFCAIAIEKGVIQAVLIAFVEPAYNCVWIWQAHARQGFRHSRRMFNGLCHWTRSKGMKMLGLFATSERLNKLYERRYGFKMDGQLMFKVI
jgi:hypothetical protein